MFYDVNERGLYLAVALGISLDGSGVSCLLVLVSPFTPVLMRCGLRVSFGGQFVREKAGKS